ncbi:hypothetical protein BASA81_000450 [Batrachochytrium salamandrivorans]|nr:hypothetical protein BASA81_000450 [Batrachochytrium salamandrivorans]
MGDNVVGSLGWVMVGPMMYLARILEIDEKQGYFVHYDRWNSKWDEWVSPPRFLPNTEENKLKSLELKRKAKVVEEEGKEKKKKRLDAPAAAAPILYRKRVKSPCPTSTPEVTRTECELESFSQDCTGIKLPLTDMLKSQAVKDWERVCVQGKHLPLPAMLSVSKILADFVDTKGPSQVAAFEQTVRALEAHFNLILVKVLLYPEERARFTEFALGEGVEWSHVCGVEYLVRFLLRLPHLLMGSALNDDELKLFGGRMQDFIRHLTKHSADLFTNSDDTDSED